MSFCPKKTTNAPRCIISDQTFSNTRRTRIPKVKNKVRNEILKMDACEHQHLLGIETSSLLSLRHFATGTGTNIYLLEFIKYEKALWIVSADHEKTFHTADHQILSQKLYHRGI